MGPGALPAAPVFGPSPARRGSAKPLRALDRLLPAQLLGLYRGGRPNGVRRPREVNELCCYFKSSGPGTRTVLCSVTPATL